MATPQHLASLNAAQRQAAAFGCVGASGQWEAPPLLVIAGAGTGKTNTLAHRVAHLVLAGVDPVRILLLTFTRRAASEMTRRAERIVATALAGGRGHAQLPAIRLPWSGTFHSIANRLLREYASRLGLDPSFSVLDRGDAADLMDLLRDELRLSELGRRFPRKDTCIAIYSRRVNSGLALTEVLARDYPWCTEWAEPLTKLFTTYVERKLSHSALDYDDLLLYWRELMRVGSLAEAIGSRFDQVLVDEYQDVNTLQAEIVLALKPSGRGVTVVGDDAQSIYSFRAASVDNILDFPSRFDPPATLVTLEQNYRSVQPVLDLANTLIAGGHRGHRKQLRAERGGGALPRLVTVQDEQQQADFVVRAVLDQREAGVALRRQAVLFRTGHHSDLLEVCLMRANIPYVKYGGLRFLEAAHVKDLLAVLRWADNPKNVIAAFRVLQLLPGVGPAHARRCLAGLQAGGWQFSQLSSFEPPAAAAEGWIALYELLRQIAAPTSAWPGEFTQVRAWYQPVLERLYESADVREADLEMLEQLSGQFVSRERFLTELALDPPAASGDLAGPPLRDEDYLVLSTVHSAKGQEWDAVYLLNVADGNFPNEFATDSEAGLDEERRLLYVAMTRARDTLVLLEPQRYYVTQQSRRGDKHVYGARSRFLDAGVLAQLEVGTWQLAAPPAEPPPPGDDETIDLAARLRSMW